MTDIYLVSEQRSIKRLWKVEKETEESYIIRYNDIFTENVPKSKMRTGTGYDVTNYHIATKEDFEWFEKRNLYFKIQTVINTHKADDYSIEQLKAVFNLLKGK